MKTIKLPNCPQCKKPALIMLSSKGTTRIGCPSFQGGCKLVTYEWIFPSQAKEQWKTMSKVKYA